MRKLEIAWCAIFLEAGNQATLYIEHVEYIVLGTKT